MQTNKIAYLQAMGIQTWQLKHAIETTDDSSGWDNLRLSVESCTACALSKGRTQTVFGVGAKDAEVMVIGEAPGFYEDQKGEPFVGQAGQLLTAMLAAIGLTREQVFITNVLKCRTPDNRDPHPEEISQCTPFLEQQIALIKPKVLLALGKIPAHYLLKETAPMSALRGQIHHYQNIPLIVTYHPAYLLRMPKEKKKAFEDLLSINRLLKTIPN